MADYPDLSEIRTRLAAVPEGDWWAQMERDGDEDGYCDSESPTGYWMIAAEVDADGEPFWYDAGSGPVAEFIAHAPADMRALLARAERLPEVEDNRNRAVRSLAAVRGAMHRPLTESERDLITQAAADDALAEAVTGVYRARLAAVLTGETDAP